MNNIFDGIPTYPNKKVINIPDTYNVYDVHFRYIDNESSIDKCLEKMSVLFGESLYAIYHKENYWYIITVDGVVMGHIVLNK